MAVTLQTHTRQPAPPPSCLPGGSPTARLLGSLFPPMWPPQAPPRPQHGGLQELKPHVRKGLDTGASESASGSSSFRSRPSVASLGRFPRRSWAAAPLQSWRRSPFPTRPRTRTGWARELAPGAECLVSQPWNWLWVVLPGPRCSGPSVSRSLGGSGKREGLFGCSKHGVGKRSGSKLRPRCVGSGVRGKPLQSRVKFSLHRPVPLELLSPC